MKESWKLSLFSRIGNDIFKLIFILFSLPYLITPLRSNDTADDREHFDFPESTIHFHPYSIKQLAEHPSPLRLLPSSH